MALELVNATFDAFVDFARAQAAAGRQKAVARADVVDLGRIVTRSIKPASGDTGSASARGALPASSGPTTSPATRSGRRSPTCSAAKTTSPTA